MLLWYLFVAGSPRIALFHFLFQHNIYIIASGSMSFRLAPSPIKSVIFEELLRVTDSLLRQLLLIASNVDSFFFRRLAPSAIKSMIPEELLRVTDCLLRQLLLIAFTGERVYDDNFRATYNLTHWGRDKMAAISQTTLSIAFSWMKMLEFRLIFHWSLFLSVQLTIFQHWFR